MEDMGDRRLGTVGAATGLAFAVLELLAGFIYPQQPRVDGPPAATVAWAQSHRVALQTGMIFGLAAAGLLIWFAGYLFTRMAGGSGSRSGKRCPPRSKSSSTRWMF